MWPNHLCVEFTEKALKFRQVNETSLACAHVFYQYLTLYICMYYNSCSKVRYCSLKPLFLDDLVAVTVVVALVKLAIWFIGFLPFFYMHNFVRKPLTKSSPLSLEINEEQQPINGTEAHAATERPQSDEYETSSVPMTTPMPSTFAGKM